VGVQLLVCLLFILIAVASAARVPVVWGCPMRCERALNFVHYVCCVYIFYARRLRTLRELLQKPPYVVVVVEFCVYLIHLSLWYCKSRQRSFVRFLVLCFSADHRKLLRVSLYCCSRCAVTLQRASKLNCDHAWSELWHVNSLQTLCWEIGDKSRSWNKIVTTLSGVAYARLHSHNPLQCCNYNVSQPAACTTTTKTEQCT